ncbi:hypothetical protein TB2_002798 [Malus domestica]
MWKNHSCKLVSPDPDPANPDDANDEVIVGDEAVDEFSVGDEVVPEAFDVKIKVKERKLELENESKQASLLSVLEEKLQTLVVGCLKILLHNFYCYIESSSNLQYGAVSFPYPSLRLLPNAFSSSSYSPLLRRRSSQSQALTFLVPKRAQIRGAKASQCRLKRQVVGKAVTVF